MCVWQAGGSPDGGRRIVFDAADQGLSALGHIVEHDWLRLALWQGLEAQAPAGRLSFLAGEKLVRVALDQAAATLVLGDGARLRARLVIGADGTESFVRESLGLGSSGHSYGQLALVAHVSAERAHQDTAWQCFRPAGPVALLPLADGRCSIVWSLPEAEARALHQQDEAGFGDRLTEATAGVLGRLSLTTPRLVFPLAARHAHRYTAPRCALVGDAAHQVHPLAGQGINLGLLDAAELAETLALHLVATRLADPGDARVLRRYERARKGPNLAGLVAMDALHRAFTSPWPGVPELAGTGLALVDGLGPLKRWLARQAMGGATAPEGRDSHAGL
jgi:2-octaprenylphenol hydroxylase